MSSDEYPYESTIVCLAQEIADIKRRIDGRNRNHANKANTAILRQELRDKEDRLKGYLIDKKRYESKGSVSS